jgi:hypothetical protein
MTICDAWNARYYVFCSMSGIVRAQSDVTRSKGAVLIQLEDVHHELIKLKPKCPVPDAITHTQLSVFMTV